MNMNTRHDFINVNEDISDYTLITMVTANGEESQELGEYAVSSFNIEFEESFLNNEDGVIDTAHV